jgi:hypothetical protein
MVMLGQLRGDLVPARVVLRVAMDEEERRAGAVVAQANYGPAGAHIEVRTPASRVAGIVGGGCHGLLRLDVGCTDHLGPLLGIFGDELSKLGG